MTAIELSKQARADAIASIQRYFEENMPEPVGELPAGLLLNFFLEEVGPAIYNRAIADAQARMAQRVSDLSANFTRTSFSIGRRWTRSAKIGGSGSTALTGSFGWNKVEALVIQVQVGP
jgi:uncharacterized protein (DUF2164 family)